MRLAAAALATLALVGCESGSFEGPAPPPEASPTPAPPSDDPDDWPSSGPACGLESDPANFEADEGDDLEFTVACTGELATGDALIAPLQLPTGASFDAASRTISWSTGVDSAGSGRFVFDVRPADRPDAVPTAETVVVPVTDDPFAPGAVAPDPLVYTHEWGVPVIHVDTHGGLSQEYVGADIAFDGVAYDASIKIRGASSTSYPKNSYTMEFNGEELDLPDWGVTRDHLVLVTTFDDNSYVRQKLIYDQWNAIADYWEDPRLTPRTFFVVLYLNGDYHGLYTALDRIDNEFIDQMGFFRDSNVYKAINHDANFGPNRANGSSKGSLHDGYTKEEGPPGDFSDLDALVGFTSQAEPEDLIAEADDWIDLAEFMDWFLLVHYSHSGDSAGKNSYLVNDPANPGFRMTPWDFNHSWGQNWFTARTGSGALNDFSWNNRVFWAVHQVPSAEAELWDRFVAMRADGPFDPAWIEGQVDGYYDLIDRSAARDWEQWADAYYAFGRWEDDRNGNNSWTDYEAERAYLYEWLEERAVLFEANHPD
ncbi:MAG: hypothetical protein GY898_31435 [Proteobacteria bacterium]|nr:hypothetical protein [Pseudomonadota bacterium]